MLLAIDIGNSNVAFGLYDDQWRGHRRLSTDTVRTADEYETQFRTLLGYEGVSPEQLTRVAVSSVVPPLRATFRRMLGRLTTTEPLWVDATTPTSVAVAIDHPTEIGSDLLVNAVAAYALGRGSCAVVDFGTALSITMVDHDGRLVGGAIAPGLESAMRALSTQTAQLPFVPLAAPPSVVGQNTTHAIQSGVVLGYVGLVEYLVRRLREALGDDTYVIATGGRSDVIAPLTDVFDTVAPWLTLEGLRLVAEQNPPAQG